ncbi:MAG TPA: amidohydrolase family protein [Solirubrobacteraceae bacterium]|jgi:predicted TIM-barrel fold metal-dependent hydrolase|nr:amidohydrolase family protein [Solirubrobacteraceae bacterium]
MEIDVHQHIWTAPLLDALEARSELPFVRRANDLTMLHSAGEHPYVIDVETELPPRRAGLLREDGLDLAVIAISSPIGIEALDRPAALDLIESHLTGVEGLPGGFAAWGPIAVRRADPDDVDSLVARGCVGVSLPAGALAGGAAMAAVAGILRRVEELGVPLFVHPGPASTTATVEVSWDEPIWWRALTDYVAQMQAAWLTFAAAGRRAFPGLRVVFAMLAGGAPLLSERLAARGGPRVAVDDRLSFYDTSSYGPAAIAAMAARVGADQLLYGSDRPVVEPAACASARAAAGNADWLAATIASRA